MLSGADGGGGGGRAVCCSWECKSSSFGYDEAKLLEAFGTYGTIEKVTAPKSVCQQGTGVVVFKHRSSAASAVAGWQDDAELKVWKEVKDGVMDEDASVETAASGEGGLTSEEDLQVANKVTREEQAESEIETLADAAHVENAEAEAHKRSRREGREKKKKRRKEKSERGEKSKDRKSRERYSAKSDDEPRKSELVEHKRRRKDDRDKRKDEGIYPDRKKEREARHKEEDSPGVLRRNRDDDGDERYSYRDVDEEEGHTNDHQRRQRYRDDDCYYDRYETGDKDHQRQEGGTPRHKDREKRRRREEPYDDEEHRRSHKYKDDATHEQGRKRHRDRDDGTYDDEYKDREYRRSRKDDGEYRRSYKDDEGYLSRHRDSKDSYERPSADNFRRYPRGSSSRPGDREYRNRGSLEWSRTGFPPYSLHSLHYSMYGYGYYGQEAYSHAGWYGYHGAAATKEKKDLLVLEEPSPGDSQGVSHEQPVELQAKTDEDAASAEDPSSVKAPAYLEKLRKTLSSLKVSAVLAGPEAYGEYARFMADEQIEAQDVELPHTSVTAESDDDMILEVDPEAEALLRSEDIDDKMFPSFQPSFFEEALKLVSKEKQNNEFFKREETQQPSLAGL